MNVFFWILQVLIGLHTLMGAAWKFTNSSQSMPSLQAIPNSVWLGMGVVEIVAGFALVGAGMTKSFAYLVPIAAIFVAFEMIVFCGVHMSSGVADNSPMIYWGVVAVICAVLAYGRLVLAKQ